ncbi:uncharacterized protein [Physcomitrium patens]|uniref:uncharacterized protein n=1 Tax=Physcomitrium patens TaxID=3218 RepID=UPI003CCDC9FA
MMVAVVGKLTQLCTLAASLKGGGCGGEVKLVYGLHDEFFSELRMLMTINFCERRTLNYKLSTSVNGNTFRILQFRPDFTFNSQTECPTEVVKQYKTLDTRLRTVRKEMSRD